MPLHYLFLSFFLPKKSFFWGGGGGFWVEEGDIKKYKYCLNYFFCTVKTKKIETPAFYGSQNRGIPITMVIFFPVCVTPMHTRHKYRIPRYNHHHHVHEGLGLLSCSLILKVKLVPPIKYYDGVYLLYVVTSRTYRTVWKISFTINSYHGD
jgi:hypothetical protein